MEMKKERKFEFGKSFLSLRVGGREEGGSSGLLRWWVLLKQFTIKPKQLTQLATEIFLIYEFTIPFKI